MLCFPSLLQVLPSCLLLHFAAADLQEAGGDMDAARQVYQELLPSLAPDEPPATPPPQVSLHACLLQAIMTMTMVMMAAAHAMYVVLMLASCSLITSIAT